MANEDRLKIQVSLEIDKRDKQAIANELSTFEKNLTKKLDLKFKINTRDFMTSQKQAQKAVDDVTKAKQKQEAQDTRNNKKIEEQNRLIAKGREAVRLFNAELERKSTRLTSGKNKSFVDQGVLGGLQSQAQGITINSMGDLEKSKAQMKDINSQFKDLTLNAQQARGGFTAFSETAVHSLQKFTEFFLIGGLVVGTLNQIKQVTQTVYDLDNALNGIRIVTGQTQEEVYGLVSSFKELAKAQSLTIGETAKAYSDLTRQGLAGQELEDRLKGISVYSKIAGVSMEESTDLITSATNGTKKSVEEVIDVFATLSDQSSADAKELGVALSRTASVANVAGIEFEKLSAYIATISEVSRVSASTVGNSIRSMIVRFNQLRETGFNEEDTTKINDVVQALSTIGIDAFDDATNSLMNFTDIIDALAPKWDLLDDKTRTYVQTALAGNFQADKFAILMENQARATELYGMALDSAGSAQQKFEIYQESAEAKSQKFKLALEELYIKLLSSDVLKGAIDSGTKFVEILSLGAESADVFASQILVLASAFTALKASSLVAEGGLLFSLGLTAPQLAGIALLVGGIATAVISYKNALEEAKVSAENFKKAQDELNYSLGKGGAETVSKAEKISELVDEYDEQARRIKVISEKIQFMPSESPEFGTLANELAVLKKGLEATDDELAKYGVTAQTARAKVEELNKAFEDSKIQSKALADFDLATKQKKELDTVKNLVSSYDEWTNKKKKSKEEDEKVKSISTLLEAKLKDLNIAYELNSEGLVTNTDKIGGLITAKTDLTNATITNATKEMEADKTRLTAILNNIKIELEARKVLAGAIATSLKPQIVQELDVGSQKAYGNTALAGKNTAFLEGQLAQYQDQVVQIDNAINEVASKISGVPDLMSGTGDTKAKKEKQSDILDNFRKQISLVEELSSALNILKTKSDLAEGDDKIKAQNKVISGYKNQQNALNLYSNSIRDYIKTHKVSQEDLEKLNGILRQNGEQWWSVESAIKSVKKEQDDYNNNTLEQTNKKLEDQIKDTQDLYKQLADALEKQDEAKLESFKQTSQDRIDVIDEELKTLERLYNKATDKIAEDDLNKKISDLTKQRQMEEIEGSVESAKRIYEIDKELVELKKQQSEMDREQSYKTEKEKLEDAKDKISKEVKAEEEALRKRKLTQQYYADAKVLIEQNALTTIVELLKTYDEQFALDGQTKGQKWLDQFALKLAQAQALIANVTGNIVTVENKPLTNNGLGSIGGVEVQGPPKPTKSNQQAYLEYLKGTGTSGQKKWAESQLAQGKYATGGVNDFTGLAKLDGTKSMPELVLNSSQISNVASQLGISGSPSAMANKLYNFAKGGSQASGQSPIVNINMNVNAEIASNMDINNVSKTLAYNMNQEMSKRGIRI